MTGVQAHVGVTVGGAAAPVCVPVLREGRPCHIYPALCHKNRLVVRVKFLNSN